MLRLEIAIHDNCPSVLPIGEVSSIVNQYVDTGLWACQTEEREVALLWRYVTDAEPLPLQALQ